MIGAETRSKSTDESVKKLEAQLQSYMLSNDWRIEELGNKIDKLLKKVISPQGGILEAHQLKDYSLWGLVIARELGKWRIFIGSIKKEFLSFKVGNSIF